MRSGSLIDSSQESKLLPGECAEDSSSGNVESGGTHMAEQQEPKPDVCTLALPTRPTANSRRGSTAWKPTWKRLGPLLGLLCIISGVASLFTSLAILITSDGAPTKDWIFQPSTYLAIATAVGNQAIGLAAAQGVLIAWWVGALNGSTLAKLHRDWDIGTALLSALTAGTHTNWISLACLFSTLVAIDGPLLQRATNVTNVAFAQPAVLEITLSPQVPHGYTGWYQIETNATSAATVGKTAGSAVLSHSLLQTATDWVQNNPILGQFQGCPGKCRVRVQAPALAKGSCVRSSEPFQPLCKSQVQSANCCDHFYGCVCVATTRSGMRFTSGPQESLFKVDITLRPTETGEVVNVTTAVLSKGQSGCTSGTVSINRCSFTSAIGLYDIVVEDSTIWLDSSSPAMIVRTANNTVSLPSDIVRLGTNKFVRSTLAGVVYEAMTYYETDTYAHANKADSINQDGEGCVYSNGELLTVGTNGFSQRFALGGSIGTLNMSNCLPFYRDPTDYIIESLNGLMFRTGVAAIANNNSLVGDLDHGVSTRQEVRGEHFGHHNVYRSNYWYFTAAALVDLLCISLILPTYWGW